MKRILPLITLLLIVSLSSIANIRPNPVEAKGIVTNKPTSVRMESELVVVDLYPDSSVVECHFYMKNMGGDEKLTVGFPEMNFYQFRLNDSNFGHKFEVLEDDTKIEVIDPLDSNENNQANTGGQQSNSLYQPWYLWNTEFKAGEAKTIIVRYSLPYGVIKNNNSRYFTYLVKTGSGWEGSIGKSEIVVNLKGISKKQLINVLPENYNQNENQLTWVFSDFEPRGENDIKIYYNLDNEQYISSEATQKRPVIFVNNKKYKVKVDVINWKSFTIEDYGKLININPEEIESIEVLKDKASLEKYHASKAGSVLLVSTKEFAKKEENNRY